MKMKMKIWYYIERRRRLGAQKTIGEASDDVVLERIDVGGANVSFMYLNLRKLGGYSPSSLPSSDGPVIYVSR